MKIHEPQFTAKDWLEYPQKTYLLNVPVLPAGNIAWWVKDEISFVWELPTSLHAHGWWINAMILRELGALIATKQINDETTVTETQIILSNSDRKVTVTHTGSRSCNGVTRGFITTKIPQTTNDDAKNQIAELVCNKFHQISTFNSIYPRTVRYDNF